MRNKDDIVVFARTGKQRTKYKQEETQKHGVGRSARKSSPSKHRSNFLSQKKVCLRQCCKVKRQIQRQLSQQKFKRRARMQNLFEQHRSIDGLNNSRQKSVKKEQYLSRLKTIHHDVKRINKAKIYFLPQLKQFDNADLLDNSADNQAKHKVRQSSRNSVFAMKDENQQLKQVKILHIGGTGRTKTQDNTVQVDFGEIDRKKTNQSYIDKNKIYQQIQSTKRQKHDEQRTSYTRPYYKYLENYPKNTEQNFTTPQKRQKLTEDSPESPRAQKNQNSAPNHLSNTIFHHNKLRVSLINSSSKITDKKQIYELPKTQEEVTDYLIKYKPIQPQFNVRMLVKKPNFQIIRQQNFVYCGQTKEGKKHGKGILLTKKQLFQGLFHNDMKSTGAQKTKAGTYIGPYVAGRRQGIGQFVWEEGEYFQGQWKNGKKEGHGVWRSTKGNVYQGEWKNNKQNGKGVYIHIGGSKYTGYFKDFLKHGRGQQQFQNGDKYLGQYSEGKPHGYGTYTWKNGDIYKGNFNDGSRQGQGTLFLHKGNVLQGNFKDDKLHGKGRQKYPDGKYFQGQFVQGQKIQGKTYSKSGQLISSLPQ